MGLKRLRKKWASPKKLWTAARIKEEKELKKEFGLKNTRELWKAKYMLKRMRTEARSQLAKPDAKRVAQLTARVKKYFINRENVTIDDILSLDVKDVLARRLQTLVYRKGFAKTGGQARQLVTHGHIAVGGRKASTPGRIIAFEEELGIEWFKAPVAQPRAAAEEGAGIRAAMEVGKKPEGS